MEYAEQDFIKLGAARNTWESEIMERATKELESGKGYAAQLADNPHLPHIAQLVGNCDGYVQALCYAIRSRRDQIAS